MGTVGRDRVRWPSSESTARSRGEQRRERWHVLVPRPGQRSRVDELKARGIEVLYVGGCQCLVMKTASEVNFGGQSMDQHQANQHAYMWNRIKEC